MTPVRFGTDGVRGYAGSHPITEDVAYRIGGAAVRYAPNHPSRVVVGRDTRPSGASLVEALTAGVVEAGGSCNDAGVVPTAAVGLALHQGLADVGVVVTASHNRWTDNGFKVFGAGGRKLDEKQVTTFEGLTSGELTLCAAGKASASHEVRDLHRNALDQGMGRLGGLVGAKIAIDLAHGAATAHAAWLQERLPCTLHLIGGGDGRTNDAVGSEHLEALCDAVRRHGAHGGLAVDGDADRCRLVDERGEVVPGDAVIWLLARTMAAQAIAVTVMSNAGLEKSLPNTRVIRTDVGDRHISAAMRTHRLPLGAEESGHILFADYPAGDGLLAGTRALNAALALNRPLSQVFAEFRALPRCVKAVPVVRRPPIDQVQELQEAVQAHKPSLGPYGRIFLRYSGTEPVLRVLVEGDEQGPVTRAATAVADAAKKALA
jgi:phosphoglucosamine mutase